MSPRRPGNAAGNLPPVLVLLIHALEKQGSRDRPGEAGALRAFAELALTEVPARGVFAPIENDLEKNIDQIARSHLGLKALRKQFFDATAGVEPFATRDEIESAANHLRTVSEQAYFYAGLAFGITLVEFGAMR